MIYEKPYKSKKRVAVGFSAWLGDVGFMWDAESDTKCTHKNPQSEKRSIWMPLESAASANNPRDLSSHIALVLWPAQVTMRNRCIQAERKGFWIVLVARLPVAGLSPKPEIGIGNPSLP